MIEAIAKLPRVRLGCYPTPLVEAERLSSVLGGPRILIKRDDLSGLALGGNKCRKLEFLIGYARQKGYDSFVISGISNLSVQLTAACARLDIPLVQILLGETKEKQGNYVLTRLINPKTKIVESAPVGTIEEVIAQRNAASEAEVVKLRQAGRNPLAMQAYESTPMENAGWVDAVDEIYQQVQARNVKADYLVITTSQGGTHAGLEVGVRCLGNPFRVIGVSTLWRKERATVEVARMANEIAEYLKLGIRVRPEEIVVYDEYLGAGYGKITRGCIEAIKLMARTEGFFLDPVYTGKAMAGLIDLVRKGRFTSKDTVVFIHTGGAPALFAYAEELIS